MKVPSLSMGCIPSRSSVAPSDKRAGSKKQPNMDEQDDNQGDHPQKPSSIYSHQNADEYSETFGIKSREQQETQRDASPAAQDDVMSIMMEMREDLASNNQSIKNQTSFGEGRLEAVTKSQDQNQSDLPLSAEGMTNIERGSNDQAQRTISSRSSKENEKSMKDNAFDDEATLDLLRQYITVDYEIAQLEDHDALRAYHEKIEQLEQLERELDMISAETEEVAAAQGGVDMNKNEANISSVSARNNQVNEARLESENNSLSGNTGSISRRSWTGLPEVNSVSRSAHQEANVDRTSTSRQNVVDTEKANTSSMKDAPLSSRASGRRKEAGSMGRVLAYHTIEEVFNRKIILERERDKLKKEVELVIVECDKLQNRYKRRDEILDKLFEGKKGNGLENHLEQQLNWLLEQKHYVDQVFYAWKRAETLTSETCDQFANALEMLKRLDNFEGSSDERKELVSNINELLIKSRQNMEQAQKYNPNVDAPFFTDKETERFDKVIETLSSSQSVAIDYGQLLTVIQFAYKRAVSIRLWLEQILQTTIARDSFELAEEYKWIAIQLRKERINLIRARLQESPYRSFGRSIQERLAQQQVSMTDANQKRIQEVNRDSGVESEPNDFDIEEEIYRLLELNKSRFELQQQQAGQGSNPVSSASMLTLDKSNMNPTSLSLGDTRQPSKVSKNQQILSTNSSGGYQTDNQKNRQLRTSQLARDSTGSRELKSSNAVASSISAVPNAVTNNSGDVSTVSSPIYKLKVELDEVAKRNLQKQLDQIHSKHRDKIESVRDNNKAKATGSVFTKMSQVNKPNAERRSDRKTTKSNVEALKPTKLYN